jgi:hypothetical protein
MLFLFPGFDLVDTRAMPADSNMLDDYRMSEWVRVRVRVRASAAHDHHAHAC